MNAELPDPAESSPGNGPGTLAWLAERDGDAPAELRTDVRAAVELAGREAGRGGEGTAARSRTATSASSPPGDHVDALVEGAVRGLERALELGSDRAAASPLLAADALLTYACEAASESGASLDELSAEVNRRLATLLGE